MPLITAMLRHLVEDSASKGTLLTYSFPDFLTFRELPKKHLRASKGV